MKATFLSVLGAITVATVGVAEVKPVDWVGPKLCGRPSHTERLCLSQSARTGHYYLSREVEGRLVGYLPVALQPTGHDRPIIGANNETFRGIGVVSSNNYAVEATIELSISTPVVPNPVTHARLLTNGKFAIPTHENFVMEPVAVTQ